MLKAIAPIVYTFRATNYYSKSWELVLTYPTLNSCGFSEIFINEYIPIIYIYI